MLVFVWSTGNAHEVAAAAREEEDDAAEDDWEEVGLVEDVAKAEPAPELAAAFDVAVDVGRAVAAASRLATTEAADANRLSTLEATAITDGLAVRRASWVAALLNMLSIEATSAP